MSEDKEEKKISLQKVTDPDSLDFKEFYTLYCENWRKAERRIESVLKKFIKEDKDFEVNLVLAGDKVIGHVILWRMKHPSDEKIEMWHIEVLGLTKKSQGKGYGTKLAKHIQEVKKYVNTIVPSPENFPFSLLAPLNPFRKSACSRIMKYTGKNYTECKTRVKAFDVRGKKDLEIVVYSFPKELTEKECAEYEKMLKKPWSTGFEME